jgi:hypothetical protein
VIDLDAEGEPRIDDGEGKKGRLIFKFDASRAIEKAMDAA